jgi:hypothetical protein
MKKDLHDLIYMVWLNETKAMIMRDEPGGIHHFEQLNNELGDVYSWVKAIAHKIRYAECVHILGPNDVRHLLQEEVEKAPGLTDIVITNTECDPIERQEFEYIAVTNLLI